MLSVFRCSFVLLTAFGALLVLLHAPSHAPSHALPNALMLTELERIVHRQYSKCECSLIPPAAHNRLRRKALQCVPLSN